MLRIAAAVLCAVALVSVLFDLGAPLLLILVSAATCYTLSGC